MDFFGFVFGLTAVAPACDFVLVFFGTINSTLYFTLDSSDLREELEIETSAETLSGSRTASNEDGVLELGCFKLFSLSMMKVTQSPVKACKFIDL